MYGHANFFQAVAKSEHSSSFFRYIKVITYEFHKTQTTFIAAYAVRMLLEQLRGQTLLHTVGRCFPYGPNFPRSKLAQQWLAQNPGPTTRCGNRNACPVCSRAHEASASKRFGYTFDDYMDQGYQPWWQTLEAGFEVSMSAKDRYGSMNRLWGSVLASRGLRQARKTLGAASLRVTEETLIDEIWTPHFHVLWVFPQEISEPDIIAFLDLISTQWRQKQSKMAGLRASSRLPYTSPLDSTTVPKKQYLFKSFWISVSEKGIEEQSNLARPVDFLISAALTGDLAHWECWNAYEIASMGVRRYSFSRNWP